MRGKRRCKTHIYIHVQDGTRTFCLFRNPNELTWHNGVIPTQQLWVKIGGDKGHGSFKLNLQLCNVENPNSRQNTCLVSVFMAHDTRANLWMALQPYWELEGMNLGSVILYIPKTHNIIHYIIGEE